MNSKLSHWCNGFLEIGWLAAIVSIPLFFNIHSDRVFEPDKLTLLRSIALLMSAAWLVKFVNEEGWRRLSWLRWRDEDSVWKRPFVMPVFLLVIVYLLSTLASITPQVSWAGSYQRLQGTYTTLSYIVIFALLAATMRSREQVQRVVTAVILTSIPISFYGILQRFQLDPLPWGGDTQRRIAGHMGNAIFIAAYLIMALPLTLARIIDAFTNILEDAELSAADVIRASIYIFAMALQLAAIYWTSSRGPWLGLAVALFAFLLILLVSLRNAETSGRKLGLADVGKVLALLLGGLTISFGVINLLLGQIIASGRLDSLSRSLASFLAFAAAVGVVTLLILVLMAMRRGWRWLWLSWLLLAFFVAVGLGAFNFAESLDAQFGQTPLLGRVTETLVAWKEEPSLGRLGRLLESDRATGRVRVLIWEGALELIGIHEPLQFPDGRQDALNFLRPLLGYGPESMYVAYNRFYPPLLATVEARNASPDRSHNETFDALVITGWAGFLVWQALYLSVFYYGFKWLGVVRRPRDRNLLIGLWIGGAVGTTAVIVPLMGLPFFGVAVPFGSIIGLVLYLTYYAIFVPAHAGEEAQEPFQMERLLLISLVTAVLAHYVEIHFGIAIAATRLHFFAYVGLMFVLGYALPHLKEAQKAAKETAVVTPATGKGAAKASRRKRIPAVVESGGQDVWGPVLLHGLVLLLMVGILSFQYINYSLPPGKTITSAADLSPVEIFYQSLFLNARQNFADSPFIFMMIVLTWALGMLVSLSELVKSGELTFTAVAASAWPANRRQTTLILLAVSILLSLGGVIYSYTATPVTPSGTLGRALLLLWLILSAVSAAALYQQWRNGRLLAALVALAGFLFVIPLFVAGAWWQALLLATLTLALLYSLWDRHWKQSVMPALVMGITSISFGLLLGFLQANQLKGSITPTAPRQFTAVQELRVFEAGLVNGFLTLFYAFVIVVLIAGAFVLARHAGSRVRAYGNAPAFVALVFIFALALYGVVQTNLRVVQADMVFKRGKPFENQAAQAPRGSEQAIAAWDSTIAIYEYALELAPREDFYYLFLGRAYLERSTIEPDPIKRQQLFQQAEERLLRAQAINPLNTDHTANLARLNTRLVQLAADDAERTTRLQTAESYYRTALTLSPQNSVIRNELGVLLLELKGSCEEALAVYRQAVTIDPYFATAHYALADGLISCAEPEGDGRIASYREAAEALRAGLERDAQNARAWLQLAQVERELGQYAEAILAYENALANDTRAQLPAWNVNYLIAEAYQALGDTAQAEQKARLALSQAPAQAVPQVQQLLLSLGVDASSLPEPPASESARPPGAALQGERPLASLPPVQRNNYYNAPPPFVIDVNKSYEAIIQTERGDIRLRLFDDAAPLTVNNFVFLAEQGFYDDTTFHRVLPDFMAQAGDPTGSGAGGPGYQFADEVNNGLVFDRRGLLAMANAGPGTNGSQFFITFAPTPWLDNRHTIFGEVIAGDEVLSNLTLRDPMANPDYSGDRILRIDIVEVTQ